MSTRLPTIYRRTESTLYSHIHETSNQDTPNDFYQSHLDHQKLSKNLSELSTYQHRTIHIALQLDFEITIPAASTRQNESSLD
jgi:hypothetical protein